MTVPFRQRGRFDAVGRNDVDPVGLDPDGRDAVGLDPDGRDAVGLDPVDGQLLAVTYDAAMASLKRVIAPSLADFLA